MTVGPDARIDAHQHFWDVESGDYAWPTAADGLIHRTFGPDDLEPLLAPNGMDATVLVQAADTLKDTDSMLAAAADRPWIAGVVGWVPLEDPVAAAEALDGRAGSALRGIRHLIHHEPDPDWIVRPAVDEGLTQLERRGLAFDVVAVFPDHLRHVPSVADRHPGLTLVIDHLAKPPFQADGWPRWRDELRAAAARPNVVAKVSGLDTAAGPGWTVDDVRPALDTALEAFGPDRLMFGSDWPVSLLTSTYARIVEVGRELVERLSEPDRSAVLGRTARRVYRL